MRISHRIGHGGRAPRRPSSSLIGKCGSGGRIRTYDQAVNSRRVLGPSDRGPESQSVTESVTDEAIDPVELAIAAVGSPIGGVWVLFIDPAGHVRVAEGLDRRSAIQAIRNTIRTLRTETWDRRKKRFVARLEPPPVRQLTPAERWVILERDGFRCAYCGAAAPEARLEVDHRVPRSRGGTNDPSNLVTACDECNGGKSDRELGAA